MNFIILFFICGIIASLVFPPFFLTSIGFAIFPYIFYLISKNEFIEKNYYFHFTSGFFFGLGFFLFYLGWIKEPFLIDSATSKYYIFSFFLIIYCSIFFGIIFLLLKYFNVLLLKFITFPLLFILAEYILGNLAYGFPWFSLSLVHSANIFGSSMIYYVGTYGLSYLTLVIFLFPTIFIFDFKNNKKKLLFSYCILLSIILILLYVRIIPKNIDINTKIKISIIQLNFNNSINIDSLQKKYETISKIISNSKSDLIIFGENNYPYIMNENNISNLQNILNTKSKIIIGSTRKQSGSYYNTMFLISKKNFQKFDKKILVPFGEFIPFRNFFKFMEFIAGTTDYSVGQDIRLMKLDSKISFIPVICYEIIYFWKLINSNNSDSNFIVNITNDSWFGKFSGPYQHFYFNKLRAAEFNKLLIRVSNNGISGLINNHGKIVDYIKLNDSDEMIITINASHNKLNLIIFHKFFLLLIFLTLLICFLNNRKYANKKI